jgi:hypothetical protein
MIRPMAPGLLFLLLVAGLLALLPVWRLRVAGWPARALAAAWALYAGAVIVAVRFPGVDEYLLPILVIAFLAPFVVAPERISRAIRRRPGEPGVVIDVTPRPPPGLPEPELEEPPRSVEGDVIDDTTESRR